RTIYRETLGPPELRVCTCPIRAPCGPSKGPRKGGDRPNPGKRYPADGVIVPICNVEIRGAIHGDAGRIGKEGVSPYVVPTPGEPRTPRQCGNAPIRARKGEPANGEIPRVGYVDVGCGVERQPRDTAKSGSGTDVVHASIRPWIAGDSCHHPVIAYGC